MKSMLDVIDANDMTRMLLAALQTADPTEEEHLCVASGRLEDQDETTKRMIEKAGRELYEMLRRNL